MTNLASNLMVLRANKKRSQEVVAIALGVPRSTYSSYENGAAEPSCELLLKMSRYYMVRVDDLLARPLVELRPSEIEELQRRYF